MSEAEEQDSSFTPANESALGESQAIELDRILTSTGTPWGTSRWDEVARCEVAAAIRYEPGRYKLPVVQPEMVSRDGASASQGVSASSRDSDLDSPTSNREIAKQIGSLVHACIAWLAEAELEGSVRSWRDVLERANEQGDRWDPLAINGGGSTMGARMLMPAYLKQWGERWDEWCSAETGDLKLIAVEQRLQCEIGGLPLTTAADLILESTTDGRIWFADHKTRGATPSKTRPFEKLREQARVRPQFIATSVLVREHYNLDYYPGVLLNTLVKTKTPAFFRVPTVIGNHQVAMWRMMQETFAQRRADGIPPVPNMRECGEHPFGLCWAYDICHGDG